MTNEEQWVSSEATRNLPKTVITAPLAKTAFPASGLVATSATPYRQLWWLHAEFDATPQVIATLLAVLILNDEEEIIAQPLMPRRAPSVFLLKNGELRATRGFLLPQWAIREIERIGTVLIDDCADYLRAVSTALLQGPDGLFKHLKDGDIFPVVGIPSVYAGPPPPTVQVDVSASERVALRLRWDQIVANDYARNRYMALSSDEQLARRTEDILGNIHVLDELGRVSVDRADPYLAYWLARLSEMQAEMALRHGPHPAGWDKGLIDLTKLPSSVFASRSASSGIRLRHSGLPHSNILVKYSKRQHLEPLLKRGVLRLTPATSYDDESLNNAVRDDELTSELWWDRSVPFNPVPPGTMLGLGGREFVRVRVNSNFYVHCFSSRLSTRLLFDFCGDACVVIHDREAFLDRVRRALPESYADWRCVTGNVEYYDPLQVQPNEVTGVFSKHFRFGYQREVRIALIPPAPIAALELLELTVGPLEDIAELVTPETTELGSA